MEPQMNADERRLNSFFVPLRVLRGLIAFLLVAVFASSALAAETQRFYLSGKGTDDAVQWDFTCSAGQSANKPSKIKVPWSWELQGFGIYNYGRDPGPFKRVEGVYSRSFTLPADWNLGGGTKVNLVFEGVQTDTQATLNGKSVGPKHQGGFYRFKYDVTALVKTGENALVVTVDDDSENPSVNKAERRADYWNYGGIYRPVYLEAVPTQSIERVAINAKADGSFDAAITLNGISDTAGLSLEAQVFFPNGKTLGEPIVQPITDKNSAHLGGKFVNPQLWTAETPNLYDVEFTLKHGNDSLHSIRQRFGFRTIEVREPGPGVDNPGVFVNGGRVMFKGSCRHSFWPDSGRALSAAINRADVLLMKDMNMNAVRMTHYPPDADFLDACDELGLYVLDEIGGWHGAYDAPTGHKLVEEMVARDVNHPSILFWDNGNEGGFNPALDDDYAKWDPQARAVLHPWASFRGIDTKHYPNWSDLHEHLNGNEVYFPTEMVHANYDGGGGASLQDYWDAMRASKNSAGGFIWAYLDEDVVRTDEGGKLDSRGNQAPDGIVGPYREKEGSYYAIKQIWSPIVVTKNVDESYSVENRYDFTDAKDCTFRWECRTFKGPNERGDGYSVVASGKGKLDGSLPPGKAGKLVLDLPATQPVHDCFAITALDPTGHELWTWTWLVHTPWTELLNKPGPGGEITVTELDHTLTLTAPSREGRKPIALKLSELTGEMLNLKGADNFFNGPRVVTGSGTLKKFDHQTDGKDHIVTATFDGDLKSLTYRFRPNGWLTIDYEYTCAGPQSFIGVGFDYYSEVAVRSIRYLGQGPYRVWKNRTAGGTMNVWTKAYNNTITGDVDNLAPGEHLNYPEFKGFHADVQWLQMDIGKEPITILVHQPNTYVQFFTPQFSPVPTRAKSAPNFPGTDISFLTGIAPIGSKFVPPNVMGPSAQDNVGSGTYRGSISIFGGRLAD